jgi:hypothetical protein
MAKFTEAHYSNTYFVYNFCDKLFSVSEHFEELSIQQLEVGTV